MVLGRQDADDEANAAAVRESRFLYLSGGSPMHLRSVLKDSVGVGRARGDVARRRRARGLVGGRDGALRSHGRSRGAARSPSGLGLIEQLAFIPHHDTWSPDKAKRTIALAPARPPARSRVDERTAVIRATDGTWSVEGAGTAVVFVDGREAGLDALPG